MTIKNIAACIGLMLAVGCESTEPASCTVVCSTDAECPEGQTCGELGRCTAGRACPCTAGEVLGCADATSVRVCNAAGNGLEMQSCGAVGCNFAANRCNECTPNVASCTDANTVQVCGDDGAIANEETCAMGCATSPAAHCRYVSPAYMPDVCDELAPDDDLVISALTTIDTSADASCSAIVAQTSGPPICVVRHRRIDIQAAGVLRAIGTRPLALVADDELLVTGKIDVGARAAENGAGGGTSASGALAYFTAASTMGTAGGGAGFRHVGGFGGGGETGGGILDPSPTTTGFIGGPKNGGGGGGALALIACRGTVTMPGTIQAGGGGGPAGTTRTGPLGNVQVRGGSGGGAGGFVIIEGAQVSVTGGIFANGGGGGAGCGTSGSIACGGPGQDGYAALTAAAPGHAPNGNFCDGGAGGTVSAPVSGNCSSDIGTCGGGGGAAGRIRVYAPAGVTATTTGVTSPPIDTPLVVPTR